MENGSKRSLVSVYWLVAWASWAVHASACACGMLAVSLLLLFLLLLLLLVEPVADDSGNVCIQLLQHWIACGLGLPAA